MSKRIVVNLLATLMVVVGGMSLATAKSGNHVTPMQVCGGGGGTCSCDAGQTCYSSSSGCICI